MSLFKKLTSFVLSACLTLSAAAVGTIAISAPVNAVTPAYGDYGLMATCQEGTILHCFDWKYTDIMAELPNIAAAGFTSVQTSPAQPGGNNDPTAVSGTWWWLYQPLSFSIGTNYLGTKL